MLVAAFSGWFDVAGATRTAAVRHLGATDGVLAGSIDPDGFFDFTVRRPRVTVGPDERRAIVWPRNELHVTSPPGTIHDLVLLAGEEPNIRWATFVELLVDACRRLRCELVVTLGTVADAHPHTRPPTVVGSSTDDALARRLGLDRPRYRGSRVSSASCTAALERARTPAISLRAPVPYYISGSPNPKATVALLADLERVLVTPTGHRSLAEDVAEWERRHDEAVAESTRTLDKPFARAGGHVSRRLSATVIDGNDLAAELESFLREQRTDDEGTT